MNLTPKQVDESFQAIQVLFRRVRSTILAGAGKSQHTNKPDDTPVTDIDIKVENTILAELKRQSPDMPVFGEESGYGDDLTGDFWLIDPLDGTKSFVQGIPAYTSMAVLIQGDKATASVIYNPATDAMYTAQKGEGAYKNGKRLDLDKPALPNQAFCRERLVDAVNEMMRSTGVVCEAGPTGAGYGFSQVAEGRVAARFNFPHKPAGGYIHDYAPGALLVFEAGGAIVPIESNEYTYKTRSFVACHPKLESIVRQNVQKLRRLELQTTKPS